MERRRGIPQPEDRREQTVQRLIDLVRDFRKQGETFSSALNRALDTFSDFRSGDARKEMRKELGRRFGARNGAKPRTLNMQAHQTRDAWLIEQARQHWRETGMPEEFDILDDDFNVA